MLIAKRASRSQLAYAAITLLFGVVLAAYAQPERAYLLQTSPHPVYSTPDSAVYNLKLGRAIARLSGGVQMEFNDNITLSESNPVSDLSIGPTIGIGFLLPTSREHIIQFDAELAYRWYLNHPAVNSISVAPRSRFDYRLFFDKVQVNIHDVFSVQVDPTSRPQIFGGPNRVENFRRFVNTVGVQADWRPYRRWGWIAGYDYTIDRALTKEFTALDRDEHTFSLGTYYLATPRLTLGANAAYTITTYRDPVQNDGHTFTVGPWFTWKANKHIIIDGSVGYSVSRYDQTGTIGDFSSFGGLTWQAGIRHIVNSRVSHNLRAGRSLGLGFGSNFSETWMAQYGFDARLSRRVSLHSVFAYESFRASNVGGDAGERFLAYASLGRQIGPDWYAGLSYAFARKSSDRPGNDYTQNRITLDLRHQF